MEPKTSIQTGYPPHYFKERLECRRSVVGSEFGEEAAEFISQYADFTDPGTELIATSEPFNVRIMSEKCIKSFVNMKRVNDIDNPNLFFSAVNEKLPPGGYFIGCVETIRSRKARILAKYPRVFSYPYYTMDFIVKRVFPKLKPTRRIYTVLTRGINRVMSRTETFGRLVACGFDIVSYKDIGNLTYFVCRKNSIPVLNGHETYGFIVRLQRIGRNGARFNVYKFRTMHPYAEFLQAYVHENSNLDKGGKFRNDFRVTSWGRWMRRLWLDEQPMWINWLKRDMKLVGLRPLSEQYFSLYPEEFKERRIKYKPGLIPPFYYDLPETFEEIVASEKKYIDAYDKNPLLTDFRYFWVCLYNIIIKHARSA